MANKQLADDLRAARKLIEKPEAWTKGVFARDADGFVVSTDNKRATCFCARGAVCKILGDDSARSNAAHQALSELVQDPDEEDPIACLNDAPETTHADILSLFDRAIAAAEA